MRRFLIRSCMLAATLVMASESKGQPPGPFPPGSPWNMYTTNRDGFVLTRPSNNSAAAPSNAPSRRPRRPDPARRAKPTAASVPDLFAPNIRIHYQLVRHRGTTGARLTRSPSPDSPALRVLVDGSPVYLEPDDIILRLDSLPIREAGDLLAHHSETTVSFVDHRTGRTLDGVMTLPSLTRISAPR